MSKKKIVRVFEVKQDLIEAPPVATAEPKPSLLQRMLGKKQEAPAPAEEPEDNHGLKADGESSTQQVLGRIFSVPTDSVRCALYLDHADLTSVYLTSGGEAKYANALDDQLFVVGIKDKDIVDRVFHRTSGQFGLDDVTGPYSAFGPFAVLLNVKKPVWEAFLNAKNIEQKRAAFTACISHKFYVAVLNTVNIKKANVGALATQEERESGFDVKKFITAYPVRSVIDAARAEQDEKAGGAGASADQDQAAIVQKVANRAIGYVHKTVRGGKRKPSITQQRFEKELLDILHDSPELKGNEALIGQVLQVFGNDPSMKKLVSVLGDLVTDVPAPAADNTPIVPEKAVQIDTAGMSADQIAALLAQNKTLAKSVMAQLKRYAID